MSWSSTQWLACSEDRSVTASTGFSFPAACYPPPPKSVFQILPLPGAGHLSAQTRTRSVPWRLPLLHSPLRHPRLFPVCVCAWAPVPSLLWESLGRAGGEVRSRSHLVSLLNSFLPRTSCPRQLPFLLGLVLLPADALLPSPPTSAHPTSTHRTLSRLSIRSIVQRAVSVTSLTLGKLPNCGVPQFPHLYQGDSCLGLLKVDAAAVTA